MHRLAVNIVLPHALVMVSLNQYWSLVIKLTYLANQLWISSAILLHRPITNNILIFVVLPHKSFTNNFWFCRMKSCGPKFGRTQGKFNLAWGQHPDIYGAKTTFLWKHTRWVYFCWDIVANVCELHNVWVLNNKFSDIITISMSSYRGPDQSCKM